MPAQLLAWLIKLMKCISAYVTKVQLYEIDVIYALLVLERCLSIENTNHYIVINVTKWTIMNAIAIGPFVLGLLQLCQQQQYSIVNRVALFAIQMRPNINAYPLFCGTPDSTTSLSSTVVEAPPTYPWKTYFQMEKS